MGKIALCLSGLSHNMDYYAPITKSGILDKLKPDVFIATWENDYTQCWESEHRKAITAYKPILYHTEYQKLVGDPPRTELTDKFMAEYPRKERWQNFAKGYPFEKKIKTSWGRQNMLNLFYMIWKCNELKKAHEQKNKFTYETVIRARIDRGWELNGSIRPAKKKSIFLHTLRHQPVSDWAAYGSSKDIDTYANIYPNIQKLCLQMELEGVTPNEVQAWYKWLDPHKTIELHLKNEGISWEDIPRPELRGHGIAHTTGITGY